MKVRLDPVVTLREQDEERARREWSQKHQRWIDAVATLDAAIAKTKVTGPGKTSVEEWAIHDVAHVRSRLQVTEAKVKVEDAAKVEAEARQLKLVAHQRTEGIRRVADRQRAELAAEAAKKETREMDEIASRMRIAG